MIQKGKEMQISDSEITVSVIIPVYNAEKYIKRAVQSVQRQSLPQKQIEIILIDDGSKDSSPAICDQLGQQHSNIRVFHQENMGVSVARNKGITEARGKYLAYLDADDWLSKETLKNVAVFFDKHYEEIDIVGYPLKECFPGGGQSFHYRDRILKESGIEKLATVPVNLTSINVFVKNRNEANLLFRQTMRFHEDTDYELRIAANKGAFGYVKEACYYYWRGTPSATNTVSDFRDFFEPAIKMYESWINDYHKRPEVLHYAKLTIITKMAWNFRRLMKLNDNRVSNIPLEYERRIVRIMAQVDEDMVWEHPALEQEEKLLLAAINYYAKNLTERPNFSRQPVRLEFLHIKNDCLLLEGLTQTYGTTGEGCSFLLNVNGNEVPCDMYRREKEDRYFAEKMVLKGIGFRGKILLNPTISHCEISIEQVIQDDYWSKNQLVYGKFFPLSDYRMSYYHKDGWTITHTAEKLIVDRDNHRNKRNTYELKFLRELWERNEIGGRKAVTVRCLYRALKAFKRKPLWLLSDRPKKAGDNGEALFRFLSEEKKSEISKCFLLDSDSPDYNRIVQWGKVVPMNGIKRKILHLLCDCNISSFVDGPITNPFGSRDKAYKDILVNIPYVFLQHGVTKDDVSDWLERPKQNIAGFITSAEREHRSILEGDYGYTKEEIWLTGMPRFDYLSSSNDQRNQITIMPTWRQSLMKKWDTEKDSRDLADEFYKSDFLQYYNAFLTHPRLIEAAKRYQFDLVFLPHPNFQKHINCFEHSPEIKCGDWAMSYAEVYAKSSLLITDYSSVVFDFAYLERPVIYTQPDREIFFGGDHSYLAGYFDYEKDGFGEVEYDLESTIDRIIEYMENGCIMKEQYRERVRKFFAFHDQNNCQRVYEKLFEMSE